MVDNPKDSNAAGWRSGVPGPGADNHQEPRLIASRSTGEPPVAKAVHPREQGPQPGNLPAVARRRKSAHLDGQHSPVVAQGDAVGTVSDVSAVAKRASRGDAGTSGTDKHTDPAAPAAIEESTIFAIASEKNLDRRGATGPRRQEAPDDTSATGSFGAGGDGTEKNRIAPSPDPDDSRENATSFTLDDDARAVVEQAVNAISKNGDVLDTMRHFRRLRGVGTVTVIGLVAEGIYPMAIVNSPAATPGEIGMAAATVAVGTAAGPIARARERKRAQAILEQQKAVSDVVGAPTELMTSKDKARKHEHDSRRPMDLRWYGTDKKDPPPAEIREHLTRIAAVAQTADIDHIVLPLDQVEAFLPQREEFGNQLTQTDWMHEEKRRALWDEKHGDDPLVVVNQQELAEIIKGIEIPEDAVTLSTIMHALQKVHPTHPAHIWYEQYSKYENSGKNDDKARADLAHKKLEHIFHTEIDKKHEDITVSRESRWTQVITTSPVQAEEDNDSGKNGQTGEQGENGKEIDKRQENVGVSDRLIWTPVITTSRFVGTTTITESGKKRISAVQAKGNGSGENGKIGEHGENEEDKTKTLMVGITQLTEAGDLYIQWRNPNAWHEQHRSPLSLNITDMRHMILNPEAYPTRQVRLACEQVAWLTLNGINITLNEGDKGKPASRDDMTTQAAYADVSIEETLQQRAYEREYGKKKGKRRPKAKNGISLTKTSQVRRTRRSAPIIIAAGIGGAIIGWGVNQIGTAANNNVDQALIQQAKSDGYYQKTHDWAGDPKITPAKLDQIFAQVYDSNSLYHFFADPILTAGQDVYDATSSFETQVEQSDGLQYTPDELKRIGQEILGTQPKECSTCDAPTGNVDANAKNAPVWYLQPYNGMNTEGFWSQSVYSSLYEGMTWQSAYDIDDEGLKTAVINASALPGEGTLDKSKPLVSVQQQVNFGSNILEGPDFTTPNDKFNSAFYTVGQNIVMPIPVLEGTHVVAVATEGTFGAWPIRLATLTDGTQALVFPQTLDFVNDVETIRFWLAPGDGQKLKPSLPLEPDGVVSPPDINTLWAKRLGTPLPTNPEKRLQEEEDSIENDFYSLDPLQDESVIYDREKFARAVLAGDQENCNVAAGILAISNPHLLAIVTGYLNHNDSATGPQYLSGNELHERNVTADGQMIDATPSKMTAAEAKKVAKFLSENFGNQTNGNNSGSNENFTPTSNGNFENPAQQRHDELWAELEQLGAYVIGAGVFWQRKRLSRGINTVGAWNATDNLEGRSTEFLQTSKDDLLFALYSGRNERREDEKPLSQLSEEPPTREELFAFFAQYANSESVHSYLQLIRQRRRQMTDPSLKTGLHAASGIINDLHKENIRTVNSDELLREAFDEELAKRQKAGEEA